MGWTDFTRRQYCRRTGRYASDLTDREWSLIAPFMPTPRRLGRPRKTDLREVLNALLYMASAGMTAGLDLALAFIERDLGTEIARAVSRTLVMYHRRTGGQSQFSTLLELEPKSDRIQKVLTYARRHLDSRLDVEELAGVAGLGARQFNRVFLQETGQPPAKAIENLRLEAARSLMEDTNQTIDAVAQQTGFNDRDRMRRAFLRAFGQPPQTIRRATNAPISESV